MQFTIVDGGAAVITLISAILAYSRGFTREVFAIGGWILAAAAAFWFAPMLEPLIREVPVVGEFLASSCVISTIVAFTLIVAGALLVLAVFTPIFSSMILDSPLAPIDRMLGFIFGAARGALLIIVAFLLYTQLSGGVTTAADGTTSYGWAPIDNAYLLPHVEMISQKVLELLPTELPAWFGERIDALMAPCGTELGAPATNTEVVPAAPAPEAGTVGGTGAGTATGN